jgi:hypothetical protein
MQFILGVKVVTLIYRAIVQQHRQSEQPDGWNNLGVAYFTALLLNLVLVHIVTINWQ